MGNLALKNQDTHYETQVYPQTGKSGYQLSDEHGKIGAKARN